jgi:hypothetical protein
VTLKETINGWVNIQVTVKEFNNPIKIANVHLTNLNHTTPTWVYLTLEDIKETKRRKRNYNNGGIQHFKLVSMYDIKNAFLEQFIPLSDNIHGPFRMMPPKLLHTSGSGLIMYMFKSLRFHLGGGIDRDYIDQEHVVVNNMIKRQSERDFPRGSMRNGLIDGTKCQSSDCKGNLFHLLCIVHRTEARLVLKIMLGLSDIQWRKFIHFLKSNLAMDEWFHDSNDKDEVDSSRGEISKVLTSLQKFFHRSEHTNG